MASALQRASCQERWFAGEPEQSSVRGQSPSTSLRTERGCLGSEFSGTKVNAMHDCAFARLPRRTERTICNQVVCGIRVRLLKHRH